MSVRGRPRRVPAGRAVFLWTPSALVLGAGILVVPHHVPSLPPAASRPPAAKTAPACPLPVGRQVQAVKAFREMLPVFRHPRCLNCHGGLDPFSEQHPGADQLDPALDPTGPMSPDDRKKFVAQCEDCHDNIRRFDHPSRKGGWTIPHSSVFFTDKDDEELCTQMKRFENTGAKFVSHIHDDHRTIQFIEAGFRGDRALGTGLKDYGLVVQKPPGTQADLTRKARRWVQILGPGYTSSPECGCVMPGIKLRFLHTETLEGPGGKEYSEANFELKLEPVNDRFDTYVGKHSLSREIQMALPKNCTSQVRRQEQWSFRATVDSATGNITVSRESFADQATGDIVCKQGRGTARMEAFPNSAVSMLGFGDLVFPPDSAGATRTLQEGIQGFKESLTMTLLEVPGR